MRKRGSFVVCVVAFGCTPASPAPPASSAPPAQAASVAPPTAEPEARKRGQQVLGRDGNVLAEPARRRYWSGSGPCPPVGDSCDARERQVCAVHHLVECAPGCEAYRTQSFECNAGVWRAAGTTEPACVCKPEVPRAALAKCSVKYVRVEPSEMSEIDGCAAALQCGESDIWVECDGENDGTGTSLCACWRDRQQLRELQDRPYSHEGAEACFEAAARCAVAPSSAR